MTSLETYGSWAVVTGASSGIGQAIAQELSDTGLNIVLVARTQTKLEKAARELKSETKIIAADLCTSAGQQQVYDAIKDLNVGLFVHSAGLAHVGPFLSTPEDTDTGLLAIHCSATVDMSRHFANRFQEKGRGGIMLVSSGFGFAPIPYAAVYGAAKAFVISFGEALAEEFRVENVDVLTVIPGGTKTNMAKKLATLIDMKKMPMPMGEPADVARVALAALGRKDRVIPGTANKVMAKMMALMPTDMAKARMGKMIRNALIPQSP